MFYLKRNLPVWERIARVVMGAGLAWLAYRLPVAATLAWVGWAGVATLVLTAFVGFCPACAMLGRRPLERRS